MMYRYPVGQLQYKSHRRCVGGYTGPEEGKVQHKGTKRMMRSDLSNMLGLRG